MYEKPLQDRPPKKKAGFFSKVFTLVSIFLVIILSYTDKGPPLPPFRQDFESFDCHLIEFERFRDRNGQLDFFFRTAPSVEYPPEYLPHFINISIETGPVSISYSGDQIENVTRTSHEISFSIDHTFAGESRITASCLHGKAKTLEGTLGDIVIHKPQYSTSDSPGYDHAKFHDVCLEFEKFLYFVTVVGKRPPVDFDDGTLRFEMLKWPLENYLRHKKVEMMKMTCFLVAPINKTPWKCILLTLIPLALSVKRNENNPNNVLFIFRKQVPSNAADVIGFLSKNVPVKLDDIMCFPTLLMTNTYENFDPAFNRINEMLDMDLRPLRENIERSKTVPRTIVIAENLYPLLENDLKNLSDVSLAKLKENDNLKAAIRMVSSANIFIGDHISYLMHAIWLNSNSSTVIDLTKKEYICNHWLKKLSKKIGINYVSFENEDDKCECKDFRCYPFSPVQPEIDKEKVIKEVKRILNSKK